MTGQYCGRYWLRRKHPSEHLASAGRALQPAAAPETIRSNCLLSHNAQLSPHSGPHVGRLLLWTSPPQQPLQPAGGPPLQWHHPMQCCLLWQPHSLQCRPPSLQRSAPNPPNPLAPVVPAAGAGPPMTHQRGLRHRGPPGMHLGMGACKWVAARSHPSLLGIRPLHPVQGVAAHCSRTCPLTGVWVTGGAGLKRPRPPSMSMPACQGTAPGPQDSAESPR